MKPLRIIKNCKKHGEQEFVKEKNGYFRCRRCRNNHVIKNRQNVKVRLIEYKGGKCVKCGYDKCVSSLTFHHLDPKEKEFGISGSTVNFEVLRKESDKCILVCRNCHGEIHHEMDKI
jgi:hypothetical protein